DGLGAGGWSPPLADEAAASELHEDMWARLETVDTFIFGRVTYELWRRFWPACATSPSSTAFEKTFSRFVESVEKIVVSTTLTSVDWQGASLVTGDVAKEIARRREQPGKDMAIVGGPTVAQTFNRLNLIDEYRLYVHPTIVGQGTAVLGGLQSPRALRM